MTFVPFDPLEFKNSKITNAAIGALRREINNILSSYVGWYDPFCELIQNALDAVEARVSLETASGGASAYKPRIDILIDISGNSLTVTDNGIGLDKEQFEQFLAPNFSFKTGNTRGHKGVGATYVAYGFNYMRISTKFPGFSASGRIVGARNWLQSNSVGSNPKIEPNSSPEPGDAFSSNDRGVSVTVRFDENTHPKTLGWIKADSASTWLKILRIKTALGSIKSDNSVDINIVVNASEKSRISRRGTSYLWLHEQAAKSATIRDIKAAADESYKKYGQNRKLPDKFQNLGFIYDTWSQDDLVALVGSALDEENRDIFRKYNPLVSVEFGCTAKMWHAFNDSLGLRSGYRVLTSGIQLAANNMPQGETIQIPLNRNIGRQNQVHFLFHFENYTPDLGRKGFHRELVDFAKNVSKEITEKQLSKYRLYLKANTGIAPDLARELAIDDWKKEMIDHEISAPLTLNTPYFFKPIEKVLMTSTPTREQDVIALFHQLIAGGVIRGLKIMSTNERFTYDGLFRISFELDRELYIFNADNNPLGVPSAVADALRGRVTEPKILEYKYSLDGLVEDVDSQDKHIKDIDLCVVWTTGNLYKERYGITSLLVPENSDQRQYHGITHILIDLETGARQCELIVLEELVETLNDRPKSMLTQRSKYE